MTNSTEQIKMEIKYSICNILVYMLRYWNNTSSVSKVTPSCVRLRMKNLSTFDIVNYIELFIHLNVPV